MTVSVRAAHDPLKDQAQEPPIDALVMHVSAAAEPPATTVEHVESL